MNLQVNVKPEGASAPEWLADLDVFRASERLIHGGSERVGHLLLHIISEFPLDSVVSVADAANGTDETVFTVDLNRTIERHLAVCALRLADRIHSLGLIPVGIEA